MNSMQEFAVSSNGDRWFLERGVAGGQDFVLHQGNPSFGGHETRSSADTFLAQIPATAEREALLAVLEAARKPGVPCSPGRKTRSLKIAEEYPRLGGCRRTNVDKNIVSTRL